MASAIVSALHLFALALGLPSVFLRGRALKRPLDREGFARLFAADNVWGIAALLWLMAPKVSSPSIAHRTAKAPARA